MEFVRRLAQTFSLATGHAHLRVPRMAAVVGRAASRLQALGRKGIGP
jgi:hypothetical protein